VGTGVLLLIKTVGLVAAAWWVGESAKGFLPSGLRGEVPRTGLALAALATLSAVPLVGPVAWIGANVLGVGAVARGVVQRLPIRWYGSLTACLAS
jgi:hypothetical protein